MVEDAIGECQEHEITRLTMRGVFATGLSNPKWSKEPPPYQGGAGIEKKDPGSIFLLRGLEVD